MTLLPDFGIGVAVFTNRSPSEVPRILTCNRRPAARPRAGRLARAFPQAAGRLWRNADRQGCARECAPQGHAAGACAGRLCRRLRTSRLWRDVDAHEGGELKWSWRGMWATLGHRHYETFELPVVPDRLLPDRLAITFLTDRDGKSSACRRRSSRWSRTSCLRAAAGDCTDPAFPKKMRRRLQERQHRLSRDARQQRQSRAEAG